MGVEARGLGEETPRSSGALPARLLPPPETRSDCSDFVRVRLLLAGFENTGTLGAEVRSRIGRASLIVTGP